MCNIQCFSCTGGVYIIVLILSTVQLAETVSMVLSEMSLVVAWNVQTVPGSSSVPMM